MAKLLFTVETGGIFKNADDELEHLSLALRLEFPAFFISQTVKADRVTAIVVENVGEVPPPSAWERLEGWGVDGLTIELVA